MASNNDEDVDLGLSLGSTNYRVETRLNNNDGAGANAASRIEMAFASSDPLSELIWSPDIGLSLKCADSSSADHKPFLPWNVRPSINDLTMYQSIRSKGGEDENVVDGDKLIILPRNLHGSSENGENIAVISESSKKHVEEDIIAVRTDESKVDMAINSRVEIISSTSDVISLAIPVQSEPLVCSLPNSQWWQESDDEVTSASAKMNYNNNKPIMPIPISGPVLMKLDSGSENDSDDMATKEANNSKSRIYSYREKGEGKKPFSNEDICERSTNESCNSIGFFSKGVKRWRNIDDRASKRTKMQIQESHVSKCDSSFMNWISNVVKGYNSDCNNKVEPSSSLALTLNRPGNETCDNKSPNMGFRAMFQSLYCPNTKKDCAFSVEGSKELTVADENLSENRRLLCERKNEDSQKQIILCNKDVNQHISRKIAGTFDSSCKMANSTGNNNICDNPLEKRCRPEKSTQATPSLWITRLYTKFNELGNCEQITEEAHDCSTVRPDANLDKRISDVSCTNQKISEAPENRKSSACEKIVCFFCGKGGHDLRKCPELTETELEDLLVKLSSFDGVGDSSSKRLLTINEFRKSTGSNSECDLDSKRKISPCNFVDAQNAEEISHAIRKLRLSRDDIHRWMNSSISLLHLNGFFLRLRLRNSETGLGGTGYYVARITDMVENTDYDSKKTILVDVGGIKSSVESQYVSNHDFLEDEIKDWWSRIVKSGSETPSLDELKSKVEDRTFLGV